MQSGLRKRPSWASLGGLKPKGQALEQRPHLTRLHFLVMIVAPFALLRRVNAGNQLIRPNDGLIVWQKIG
jgi:hypothetical protein